MKCKSLVLAVVGLVIVCSGLATGQVGRTEITKWQDGKRGAVSLTFDDGSINQFRVAVPIMEVQARKVFHRLNKNFTNIRVPVRRLSGGQRQVVAISRALYFNARILIMRKRRGGLN